MLRQLTDKCLDRSGIDALVGKLEPATVTKHVRMYGDPSPSPALVSILRTFDDVIGPPRSVADPFFGDCPNNILGKAAMLQVMLYAPFVFQYLQ